MQALRYRLGIEQAQPMQGLMGDVEQRWLTMTTVWGNIEPLRGRELWEARQIEARMTHRILLRYFPGFSPAWRLRELASGRLFHPQSVRDLGERHRRTEILATEILET